MRKQSVLSWMLGIVASVLGGVIVWWLTGENGLLREPEERSVPVQLVHVELTKDTSTFEVGEAVEYEIMVTNVGDQAARQCGFGAVAYHEDDDRSVQKGYTRPANETFGLRSGDAKTLAGTVPIRSLERPGHYTIKFSASCLYGDQGLRHAPAIKKYIEITQ